MYCAGMEKIIEFLSPPSARRATLHVDSRGGNTSISIPALREEGDRSTLLLALPISYFYPRPPRGGRQERSKPHCQRKNFYPRPPRGGRPCGRFRRRNGQTISIPALREEGDTEGGYVGSDLYKFLSPPCARRATLSSWERKAMRNHFYPRPPRGGRLYRCENITTTNYFYPRPPRGGRQQKQRQNLYFQTNYTTFCTNLEEP